jgi:hypothetical protein
VQWHRAFNGLITGAALLLPLTAVPESQIETGTASTAPSVTAHVNFKIVIPQVLYLRVGPGNDGLKVLLNASAKKSIAREAQCTPTPATVGTASAFTRPIVCTASMP